MMKHIYMMNCSHEGKTILFCKGELFLRTDQLCMVPVSLLSAVHDACCPTNRSLSCLLPYLLIGLM